MGVALWAGLYATSPRYAALHCGLFAAIPNANSLWQLFKNSQ